MFGWLTKPPPVLTQGDAAITGVGKWPSRLVIDVSGFPAPPSHIPFWEKFACWAEMPVVHGHVGASMLFCTHWLRAVMVSYRIPAPPLTTVLSLVWYAKP